MGQDKNALSHAASWFVKWVLNKKLVSVLTIILLILLNWFFLPKVSFIFLPIIAFFNVTGLH